MTEQERRALFFKVTGQVYALTSMGIYNAFCKGLEAGYEAGRKDENEEIAVEFDKRHEAVKHRNNYFLHAANYVRARREQ